MDHRSFIKLTTAKQAARSGKLCIIIGITFSRRKKSTCVVHMCVMLGVLYVIASVWREFKGNVFTL